MRTMYLLAAIFIILGVSFLYGAFVSEQCVSIDVFKACWSTIDKTVSSDLCPQSPCTAKSGEQQHNAIADLLLQACQKARTDNYVDAELNKRIEEVASTFTGYSIDARTLCDQPGLILVKRGYG